MEAGKSYTQAKGTQHTDQPFWGERNPLDICLLTRYKYIPYEIKNSRIKPFCTECRELHKQIKLSSMTKNTTEKQNKTKQNKSQKDQGEKAHR